MGFFIESFREKTGRQMTISIKMNSILFITDQLAGYYYTYCIHIKLEINMLRNS
jgi:hypothetical protein